MVVMVYNDNIIHGSNSLYCIGAESCKLAISGSHIFLGYFLGLNFREDWEDPYGQQYGTVSTYDRMRA
jgi:hypothetical protein